MVPFAWGKPCAWIFFCKDSMSADSEKGLPSQGVESDVCTVDHVSMQLRALEKFMARRFDEISMEINATAQQVDMAEDGISRRFAEILEMISAISFKGGGMSPANAGVELEAIITDTEDAANRILDAADRISNYLDEDRSGGDVNGITKEKIRNDIQEILMACTFQDLTGQRIRTTLSNLHQIESRLSSTFERLGLKVEPDQNKVEEKIHKASSQDEIDALLASMKTGTDA
jgi:chemotaxis protein CheZ